MSRLVMFLGIILIVLGGAGVIFGFIGVPTQFASMIDQATTPTAAELCNPGETLDEVTGQEEYTALEGWRHSVQYYCVNDAGVRRDVTGQFVGGMIGQVFGGIGSIAIPIVSSMLLVPGIILLVLGAIFSRRRAGGGNVVVRTYTYGGGTPSRFAFPDDPTVIAQQNPAENDDLSKRLIQLDAARKAGLISEDEYARKRQEILDSM
jgi:hypothetical protein